MEQFIDEKKAAKITGYSRYWFQQKRWQGGGPPYLKIGHTVRYALSDLLNWMNSHGIRRNTSQSVPEPRPQVPETRVLRTMVGGRERLRLIV